MMLKNNVSRLLPIAAWLLAVAVLGALSVALDAKISTTVALLVLSMSPIAVMWLLAQHTAPPTVAEILHAARQKP
jgi:hypothetical protein